MTEVFQFKQDCPQDDVGASEYVIKLEGQNGAYTCMIIGPEGEERIGFEYIGENTTTETIGPMPEPSEEAGGGASQEPLALVGFTGLMAVLGFEVLRQKRKRSARREVLGYRPRHNVDARQ